MANYSSNKEVRDVVRKLEKQGWRIESTRSGHYKAFAPDGKDIVTFSGTPSRSGRGLANAKAQLRRLGADI